MNLQRVLALTDKWDVGTAVAPWLKLLENRMFGTRCMTRFPHHYLIELHLSPNDDGGSPSAISALCWFDAAAAAAARR